MWNKIFGKELKWIFKVANKKRYVGAMVLIQALLSVSGVVYALLLRRVIDAAVSGNKEGFINAFGLVVGLVVTQILLRAWNRYLEEYVKVHTENAFKKRLFDQILKKDYATVSKMHSAEWLNRLTSDTAVCATGIMGILPALVGMSVKLVAALAMILVIEPMFIWIVIPAGLVMLFFNCAFRKILKRQHKYIQEKDGLLRVFLQEHISSLMILRAFVTEKQSQDESAVKMEEYEEAILKRSRFWNVCHIGFSFGMYTMYLIGGVGYCGYGILTGAISYGTFTAMLQLISQIQSPFANMSGIAPRFYSMLASAERLMEIEEYEDDCEGKVKTLEEIKDFYRHEYKGISFENAFFTYKQLKESDVAPAVLNNLSMKVEKGDYIALTGHSGCGKSTTIKLLMSLYPLDEGECNILTTNGKEPLTSEWRRLFAYVPQGNHLMCGTIRELIAFSDKTRMNQEDEIKRALEISCAWEFVKELEDGIDTVLGEKGQGLSEGQMQRLAIARAIFSECPILLLDEATSALDELTERTVLDNLKIMTDKSVLIVTHRMKALEICNKVAHFTEQGVTIQEK